MITSIVKLLHFYLFIPYIIIYLRKICIFVMLYSNCIRRWKLVVNSEGIKQINSNYL